MPVFYPPQSPSLTHQIDGNTSGTTQEVFAGTYVLVGGNNITLSQDQNRVTISGGAGAGFVLSNSNGLEWGTSGGTVTGSYTQSTHDHPYQSTGAYLTTAALSNHDHSGVYQVTGNYLTTAALSNHGHTEYQSTGAYLTTAALSNHTHSDLYQSTGAYLTTAALSNHAHTEYLTTAMQSGASSAFAKTGFTTTAITGTIVSGTHDTDGLKLAVPAYITTWTVPTVTNSSLSLSDSATSMTIGRLAFTASNGLTLTLSTATGGSATLIGSYTVPSVPAQTNQTANFYVSSNTTQLSSTAGIDLRSVTFQGAGVASIGVSGGKVLVSVPAGGGGGVQSVGVSTGGNTLGTTGLVSNQLVLVGGANITLSQSSAAGNATVTISAPSPGGGAVIDRSYFEIMDGERLTTCALWNNATYSNRPMFVPFWMDGGNLSAKTVRLLLSRTGGTSVAGTIHVGFYSLNNSTRLSLFGSSSHQYSLTTSAQFSGIRVFDITGMNAVVLTEGRWYLGLLATAAGTASWGFNIMGGDVAALGGFVHPGTNSTAATASDSHILPMWGVYSAASAGLPDFVNKTQVSGGNLGVNCPDVYAAIMEI